jgi:DNA anti-recombination protein RmuC
MSDADQDLEDLKQATREAHMAIKDLSKLMKEFNKLRDDLRAELQKSVDEQIKPVIESSLQEWSDQTVTFIDQAEDRINKRFDTLADILLGETREEKRKDSDRADRKARRGPHPLH